MTMKNAGDVPLPSLPSDRFPTEEECRERIKAIQEAFEALRRIIEPDVEHFVQRDGHAAGEFDTVVEEAFRRIWSAIYIFDPSRTGTAFGFLRTVVARASFDHLRKSNRLLPEVELSQSEPASAKAERALAFRVACDALARISSPCRQEVLLLTGFGVTNPVELARIMGLPNAAAGRQLRSRAIVEMRGVLAEMGHGVEILKPFLAIEQMEPLDEVVEL